MQVPWYYTMPKNLSNFFKFKKHILQHRSLSHSENLSEQPPQKSHVQEEDIVNYVQVAINNNNVIPVQENLRNNEINMNFLKNTINKNVIKFLLSFHAKSNMARKKNSGIFTKYKIISPIESAYKAFSPYHLKNSKSSMSWTHLLITFFKKLTQNISFLSFCVRTI